MGNDQAQRIAMIRHQRLSVVMRGPGPGPGPMVPGIGAPGIWALGNGVARGAAPSGRVSNGFGRGSAGGLQESRAG